MARKQTVAAGAATEGSTAAPKPGRTRDTALALSLSTEQKAVLLSLILDRPGQLTTRDLVGMLTAHPAFAALSAALGSDKAPEKLRQQVKKMAKAAAKRGLAVALKRVSGAAGDYDAVVDLVLRSRGIAGAQGTQQAIPSAPPAAAVQPIPGPLAGGVQGGLIPVLPQGQ